MLWNYLTGYVIIQIGGVGLERFVNRMLQEGVDIWNISRETDGSLRACVSVAGFYALHRLRGQWGRVQIREKRGLIMRLSRLRRRKVLLWGWIAVLGLLFVLSRRVWIITVEGCAQVPQATVYAALRAQGAYPGASRRGLTTMALRDAVLASDKRIALSTANLSGVVLRIGVREAEDAPAVVDDSLPAHVIAKREGVIEEVIALNGRAAVKPGDVVHAGDLLISGALVREAGGAAIPVHARGRVTARVVYVLGATAQDAAAAQQAAQNRMREIDPEAVIVEKSGNTRTLPDGRVRTVLVVVARQEIGETVPLQ